MLCLLLLILPPPPALFVRDDCDLVELNHYYDAQGKHVFDQVIFYDWSPADSHFQVVAWRLLKDGCGPQPVRDPRSGDVVCCWQDGDLAREVRASISRETTTDFDPELAEREYLSKDARRGLSRERLPPPAQREQPLLIFR